MTAGGVIAGPRRLLHRRQRRCTVARVPARRAATITGGDAACRRCRRARSLERISTAVSRGARTRAAVVVDAIAISASCRRLPHRRLRDRRRRRGAGGGIGGAATPGHACRVRERTGCGDRGRTVAASARSSSSGGSAAAAAAAAGRTGRSRRVLPRSAVFVRGLTARYRLPGALDLDRRRADRTSARDRRRARATARSASVSIVVASARDTSRARRRSGRAVGVRGRSLGAIGVDGSGVGSACSAAGRRRGRATAARGPRTRQVLVNLVVEGPFLRSFITALC